MNKSRTVIVTGAAKGIGRGIAKAFAEQSYTVILADIDVEEGTRTESDIIESGGQALFIKTDVENESDLIRLVERVIHQFGKIDVLINNAGINGFFNLFEMTISQWDQVINTNLRSVFILSKEAARVMKAKGGSIINIASTRAFMSEANSESYAAAKGGIIALTHALAATLSTYDIGVNSISPGWIHNGSSEELTEADHAQHWSNRVGKASDIARMCLFLADSQNDFITGQNMVIDGGMTKKMIYVE